MNLLTCFTIVAIIVAGNCLELGSFTISDDITVSGLSSGGFMAVQTHVALSATIKGAAIFAGGPYYCSQENSARVNGQCTFTFLGPIPVETLVAKTVVNGRQMTIDDPANMADDKIYLFSGTKDMIVQPPVMKALHSYYSNFTEVTNINTKFDLEAEHCLPTLDYGEPCGLLFPPFIGKCGYDGAGVALKTLYGDNLNRGSMIESNLLAFDQSKFFEAGDTSALNSLGTTGYIYVPTACADGTNTCKLHVSFHGCDQNLEYIGNRFAHDTGFNAWAEANNIIVLYPYTSSSSMTRGGCWDWWGYTGHNFCERNGKQISFVARMVAHIRGQI